MTEFDAEEVNQHVSTRNPPWTRDELILALDLYMRLSPRIANAHHPEVVLLSSLLNSPLFHHSRLGRADYRNPTGVYMKLNNFRAIDPEHTGTGLNHGSKRDVDVWNEFAHDRQTLHQAAEAIRAFVNASDGNTSRTPDVADEDIYEAREGALLLRQHKFRERSGALALKKKERALANDGKLRCEVCNFVFREFYGELGSNYIECHHLMPLAQLRPGQTTHLSDLALLCANCHRMIHQGGKVRSIEALRATVQAVQSNSMPQGKE